MKNVKKLKENLQDFIEERLNESYSNIAGNKNYKEIASKNSSLMDNILKKVNDIKLIDEYKKSELDMYEMQLQQAYITGFKDSVIILKSELI